MEKTKEQEKMLEAVAYLLFFITGVALLVTEKKSKYIRFHAMQSTIVFGLIFVILLMPIVGWILAPITPFVVFPLWVFLMWKAFNGEMYKLPKVGDLAEKQLAKMDGPKL